MEIYNQIQCSQLYMLQDKVNNCRFNNFFQLKRMMLKKITKHLHIHFPTESFHVNPQQHSEPLEPLKEYTAKSFIDKCYC